MTKFLLWNDNFIARYWKKRECPLDTSPVDDLQYWDFGAKTFVPEEYDDLLK